MNPSIRHIALVSLLVALPAQATGQDQSWVEISGSYYNPDWEFRESETGLRFAGHYQRGPWYVGATYNTIDTDRVDIPGVVRLRGLPFGDWRELTIGHSFTAATSSLSLRVEAAYQGITVFDSTESGYSFGAALQHRFNPLVSGSLRLNYQQLEEQDWRVTGQLLFTTGERSAVVARIDDFAEFDFTWYELGIRFFF